MTPRFRAWDKRNQKMIYDIGIMSANAIAAYAEDERGAGVLVNPKDSNFIIMQWTGLLDRNGDQIYEGDIVISFNLLDKEGKTSGVLATVVWSNNGYFIEQRPSGSGTGLIGVCEIIGTIHENKDLVKE